MKVHVSEVPTRNDEASLPGNTSQPSARPWISPRIETLPRLTDLTLQSGGIPGGGGTGGGGSTVVP